MSPKRILNVDLPRLPKGTEFFYIDFRKQEPVSNFRPNRLLYRWGPTDKFWHNRFLKTRFLVAGFYCICTKLKGYLKKDLI